MKRIFDLPVSEPWYSYIYSGLKTVEGKKRSPSWEHLQKGDLLRITNNGKWFYAEIININIYQGYEDNLEKYLITETLEKTLPGITNIQEAKRIYLTEPVSWTDEEIKKYGIMAIHLKVIKSFK